MFDFAEQVVLITGAGGNLGQATARAFQQASARLVLVDRRLEKLEAVYPDLSQSEDVLFATADLTDAGAVEGMVFEAAQHFGRIDVVANIAGGFAMGPRVHETRLETWQMMLDLNAGSVYFMARAVVPHMLQQGSGRIINVAARAGLEGKAKMGAYVVSKSAVIRLTETMSAELKDKGILVNCILPGTIDTPQNREDMPNADFSKWVAPEALADVILFLASDAARAVTGAAVPVYGRS
jgi:NAD(P)-dependent dehydrogenase (short-subunit alcohol dehydrogenase family)